MIKRIFKKIPKLPLSALIFYLVVLSLWKMGFIPSPIGILSFLENLYNSYGLVGLFIASFLEGIVYLGLYFPGSFIVALAVILSGGTFKSLFIISLVVALALTITSVINYLLGKKVVASHFRKDLKKVPTKFKGFFISALHPNALAFYFFNSGIKKKNALNIILIPIMMVPYGLGLGYLLYSIKEPLKRVIENPFIMIIAVFIWILIAFFVGNKRAKIEDGDML